MAKIVGVVALAFAGAAAGCDICEFMGDLVPGNMTMMPNGEMTCGSVAQHANETHAGDVVECRKVQLTVQTACCTGEYKGPKECDMCAANTTLALMPTAFVLPGKEATNTTNATAPKNVSCGELNMALWLGVGAMYAEPMNTTNATFQCPGVQQEAYAATCCLGPETTITTTTTTTMTTTTTTTMTTTTTTSTTTMTTTSTTTTTTTEDTTGTNGTGEIVTTTTTTTPDATGTNGTGDVVTTTTTVAEAAADKTVRGSFTLQVGNLTEFSANSTGLSAIKDSVVDFLKVPASWVSIETEVVDGGRRLGSARRLASVLKVVYTILVPAENGDATLTAESLASKMTFAAGDASSKAISDAIASATGETVSIASVEAPIVERAVPAVAGAAEASCEPSLTAAAVLLAAVAARL